MAAISLCCKNLHVDKIKYCASIYIRISQDKPCAFFNFDWFFWFEGSFKHSELKLTYATNWNRKLVTHVGYNLIMGKLFRDGLSILIGFLCSSKFRMWETKMDALTILLWGSLRENIVNKKTASCQFRDIFLKFKISCLPFTKLARDQIPENIYSRPFRIFLCLHDILQVYSFQCITHSPVIHASPLPLLYVQFKTWLKI